MKKCAPQIRAINGRTQIGIIEANSNQYNTIPIPTNIIHLRMEKVFTNHKLTSYLAKNDLEMRAKTLHGIDVKKHVYSLKYNL